MKSIELATEVKSFENNNLRLLGFFFFMFNFLLPLPV